MSKKTVQKKMLDHSSNWIRLAEDAEQEAKKAQVRSQQLIEAAQIFRANAESGIPWPGQSTDHKSEAATLS